MQKWLGVVNSQEVCVCVETMLTFCASCVSSLSQLMLISLSLFRDTRLTMCVMIEREHV